MPEIASVNGSAAPVVYFVQIGKHIKIGFSKNLNRRLEALATSTAETIKILATIPGSREVEQRLHQSLRSVRFRREFFWPDNRIDVFIHKAEKGDLAAAWKYLEDTSPERLQQREIEDRRRRVVERRKTKAEEDAYYAKLVDERRRTLGW